MATPVDSEGIANAPISGETAEIEVTPAMVEAGAGEVATYSPENSSCYEIAVDVYKAMEMVRRRAIKKAECEKTCRVSVVASGG
jgi:hypothetical protein